jgi:hypothetical protein
LKKGKRGRIETGKRNEGGMRRREDDREDEKRAGIDVACNVSLNATFSRKRFFLDTKTYRSIFFDTK